MPLSDEQINAEAESTYGQFISSKPHKPSYLGGFIVGAMWAQAAIQEAEEKRAADELAARGERAFEAGADAWAEWNASALDFGD